MEIEIPKKPKKPYRSPERERQREELRRIAAEAPDDMRLLRFQVRDILKVKFANLEPKGDVIVVGGKNGQGKSSVLKALAYLLCGLDTLPTDVIRVGQMTASITGQVGPFVIRRRFDRRNKEKAGRFYVTSVQVWMADGTELPQRGYFLGLLFDHFTFDPTEFLRMKPMEQFERMRALAKIDLDLETHDAAYEELYDQRHDNRIEWTALLNRLAALPEVPTGAAVVTQADVERLTRELQGAAERNGSVQAAKHKKLQLEQEADRQRVVAYNKREEAKRLLEEAEGLDGIEYSALPTGNQLRGCYVEELLEQASKIVVGDEIDTAVLGAQLREAQAVLAANAKAGQRAEVEAEVAAAEARWNELDEACKANRDRREEAMRTAVLPVADLTMGNGELFYKGMPFDQASGAEQLRVSLAVGMAANPKVRILRFMDGGWDMLDEDSQQMVRDEVAKHKYQLWVEHVGTGQGTTVLMTAGEAEGEDVV